MNDNIKLTEFSPGAGCGCKISPKILQQILTASSASSASSSPAFPNLLVGNETADDAAVYQLSDSEALISTTDFFTPIVDDPFDFGRIAATNAISDIYAMGGTPIMALAILGWPINKIPIELAGQVLAGARAVCNNANIPLAGGHSIDIGDPVFGLIVNGRAHPQQIKRNATATPECYLFLTKPLGIGLITTAQKRKLANAKDLQKAVELMTTLNSVGEELSLLHAVKAMTDVTGFGLLGHLLEICQGSNLNAELFSSKIPKIPGIEEYIKLQTIPGGTRRNWDSYGDKISPLSEEMKVLLCDPQTSGGLLVAVEGEQGVKKFLATTHEHGIKNLEAIGKLIPRPLPPLRPSSPISIITVH
ncbi:MAG: selenide, water dikinase SelD [Oligoflexia bacterium]|nr:selenide, water dikinase SelD [Oligoflexia bacterium]